MTTAVKKNDIIELTIDSLGSTGVGIGRVNNFAVFVPGALVGERVRGIIIKVAKNYAVMKLTDILAPSADRVQPECGVYAKCGGCTLQHMSYPAQLEFKRNRIQDCLKHIGNIDYDVPPVIGMENPWRYRNKCAFPVTSENGVSIGMYSQKSHRVVETNDCIIQSPDCSAAITALKKWMLKNEIKPYDENTNTGYVRHIVLRNSHNGDCLIGIVTRAPLPFTDELVSMFLQALPNTQGIIENINPKRTNVILGDRERVLYGSPKLIETLMGLEFEVSLQSFLQVNHVQTEKLYGKVLTLAALNGTENVVDAYCGIGTMTLMLAKAAKEVIGIEIVPSAVSDAKQNAQRNAIENVRFVQGLAEDELPTLLENKRIDLLVLDPPRKGCDKKLIDAVSESSIPRIIYVSCDPATLARDLALLAQSGYTIQEIQGYDMFPQTGHVECVALMSRSEKQM